MLYSAKGLILQYALVSSVRYGNGIICYICNVRDSPNTCPQPHLTSMDYYQQMECKTETEDPTHCMRKRRRYLPKLPFPTSTEWFFTDTGVYACVNSTINCATQMVPVVKKTLVETVESVNRMYICETCAGSKCNIAPVIDAEPELTSSPTATEIASSTDKGFSEGNYEEENDPVKKKRTTPSSYATRERHGALVLWMFLYALCASLPGLYRVPSFLYIIS